MFLAVLSALRLVANSCAPLAHHERLLSLSRRSRPLYILFAQCEEETALTGVAAHGVLPQSAPCLAFAHLQPDPRQLADDEPKPAVKVQSRPKEDRPKQSRPAGPPAKKIQYIDADEGDFEDAGAVHDHGDADASEGSADGSREDDMVEVQHFDRPVMDMAAQQGKAVARQASGGPAWTKPVAQGNGMRCGRLGCVLAGLLAGSGQSVGIQAMMTAQGRCTARFARHAPSAFACKPCRACAVCQYARSAASHSGAASRSDARRGRSLAHGRAFIRDVRDVHRRRAGEGCLCVRVCRQRTQALHRAVHVPRRAGARCNALCIYLMCGEAVRDVVAERGRSRACPRASEF